MSEDFNLEKNKELVRSFITEIGLFKIEIAESMIHPDCIFQVKNYAIQPNRLDKSEMLEFLKNMNRVIPNGFVWKFLNITAEQNRVCTVAKGVSTTIDGADYNNDYHFYHEIRDGKIVKQIEFIDSLYAAKTLGPILKKQL